MLGKMSFQVCVNGQGSRMVIVLYVPPKTNNLIFQLVSVALSKKGFLKFASKLIVKNMEDLVLVL